MKCQEEKRVSLYTVMYDEPNKERKAEYEYCIKKNIENKIIDRIHILKQDDIKIEENKKVTIVDCQKRPKYKKIFDYANTMTNKDDIIVVCNTDIYIEEEEIKKIKKLNLENTVLALSRWDVMKDGTIRPHLKKYSQDVWITKAPVRINGGNYTMGIKGCDNKIAYDLRRSGYRVQNPSKSIITKHVHLSNVRNYLDCKPINRPYYFVEPISIEI